MDSLFYRYRNLLVLLAVLVAQVILLATQMRRTGYRSREDGHKVRFVRSWEAYTIVPVEKLLLNMGHGVRGAWSGYIDLRHVRQHDRDLQYQIDQLRLRQAALMEDARQGQRLQNLLAFKQQYIGKTVAAQVIGTGGGDHSRILILNKGSDAGLAPDMAVITPDGIVGKLRDVFATSSQLLLMSDSSSGVGILLANVRSRGVLRGNATGGVQIGTLLPDDRIKPGEAIVTSGGDRVFPRGLSVGAVQSIAMDPDHQPYAAIQVKPSANLDRLEEVLVITDVGQQLANDATATQDGDDGQKRASEIVAERLPGLKEPQSAQAKNNAAGKPASDPNEKLNKITLRPTPALHSDSYTPGSVPNAADLRPGEPHTSAPPQERQP